LIASELATWNRSARFAKKGGTETDRASLVILDAAHQIEISIAPAPGHNNFPFQITNPARANRIQNSVQKPAVIPNWHPVSGQVGSVGQAGQVEGPPNVVGAKPSGQSQPAGHMAYIHG